MATSSESMRDLAKRLVTSEAANLPASKPHVHEAVNVIEKLRMILTKFAGSEGFASLLRRALVLAGAKIPSLKSIKIGTHGRLEESDQTTGALAGEAGVAVTAHLLDLLATFIGEPLTVNLVREAWPDLPLDK